MGRSMGTKDCSIPKAIKHLNVCELFDLCGQVVVHVAGRQRPPQSDSVRLARGTGACECLGRLLAHAVKTSSPPSLTHPDQVCSDQAYRN